MKYRIAFWIVILVGVLLLSGVMSYQKDHIKRLENTISTMQARESLIETAIAPSPMPLPNTYLEEKVMLDSTVSQLMEPQNKSIVIRSVVYDNQNQVVSVSGDVEIQTPKGCDLGSVVYENYPAKISFIWHTCEGYADPTLQVFTNILAHIGDHLVPINIESVSWSSLE